MGTFPGDTRSVQWRIYQAPVGSPRLCSVREQVGVRGWMPLCSCPSRVSQGLHIGANDIANPADFGVAVDFVDVGLFLEKAILQSFYCDIESDLVPELETVGDGFRSRIDADGDAFDLMGFDSFSQGRPGQSYDPE